MLIRIKDKIKNVLYKIIPPPLENVSYSQAGEDVVLMFLFQQINLTKPNYLELGVCKPDIGSNTFKFYKGGARGVLVEADLTLIPAIKAKRPNDKIINCGISPGSLKEADFYIFEEKGYNTFSNEEAIFREKNSSSRIIEVRKVPLRTINEIISGNFNTYPDFLSIDIEGLDFEVLKSWNHIQFPIPVVCAETCTFSETHIKNKSREIIDLMTEKGYIVYADTYINTIFVNEVWFKGVNQ